MESIYNLIPKEAQTQSAPEVYRSIHASTVRAEASKTKASGALFGPPGAGKPDPKNYTKRGAGELIRGAVRAKNSGGSGVYKQTVLAPASQPRLDGSVLKYVPRQSERGTVAPRTKKNFVAENAKLSAKASPNRTQNMSQALKGSKVGEVPKYLATRKAAAQAEQSLAATLQMEATMDPGIKRLSNEERESLLAGLRANYSTIHKEYLLLSVVIDTIAKRNEKNNMEAKLAELEADIAKLDRTSEVFVQV